MLAIQQISNLYTIITLLYTVVVNYLVNSHLVPYYWVDFVLAAICTWLDAKLRFVAYVPAVYAMTIKSIPI